MDLPDILEYLRIVWAKRHLNNRPLNLKLAVKIFDNIISPIYFYLNSNSIRIRESYILIKIYKLRYDLNKYLPTLAGDVFFGDTL